jgi:hypothetical protein
VVKPITLEAVKAGNVKTGLVAGGSPVVNESSGYDFIEGSGFVIEGKHCSTQTTFLQQNDSSLFETRRVVKIAKFKLENNRSQFFLPLRTKFEPQG